MTAEPSALESNPLLQTAGLPRFDEIKPEHVAPAVRHCLAEAEQKLAEIEQNAAPTWEGLLQPLEELDRPFEQAWGPVGHLLGVQNSPELRGGLRGYPGRSGLFWSESRAEQADL